LLPLISKLAELRMTHGPNHPEVEQVRHQIELVRQLYGRTAVEAVPNQLLLRVYPVRDFADPDALRRIITTTVKPESWSQRGGTATIVYFAEGKSLVVKQSVEDHKEFQELLEAVRQAKQKEQEAREKSPGP
jgi:hypothetical protein